MLTVELGTQERAKCFMERLQNKSSFGEAPMGVPRHMHFAAARGACRCTPCFPCGIGWLAMQCYLRTRLTPALRSCCRAHGRVPGLL